MKSGREIDRKICWIITIPSAALNKNGKKCVEEVAVWIILKLCANTNFALELFGGHPAEGSCFVELIRES